MMSSDSSDNSESLESISDILESKIDRLEVWMIVFTVVVVLGLLIELIPPFLKLWGDHDWKDFVGSSVGTVLVTIGVGGECAVSFWSFRRGRKLRGINAEKERLSKERLKLADERIADAVRATAEARLETEKLKAQMAWRDLPYDQQRKLISELSASPGSIVIEWVDGDAESLRFSNQFKYVFAEAKWTVGVRCFRGGNLVATGLFLYLPSPTIADATPEETRLKIFGAWEREKITEARKLEDMLKASGIEIGFSVGDLSWGWSQSSHSVLPPEPAIKLFVGSKPPINGLV
jgi:hypothetical protein